MILTSESTTAADGARVQSTVKLNFEEVGVEKLPFHVSVWVDSSRLFTGHSATEAGAKEMRKRMHAAYMKAHETVTVA